MAGSGAPATGEVVWGRDDLACAALGLIAFAALVWIFGRLSAATPWTVIAAGPLALCLAWAARDIRSDDLAP